MLHTIYHRIDSERPNQSDNGIRDKTLIDLYQNSLEPKLAWAVDVMMARQRDLHLMIKVNKLKFFSSRYVIKEIE